MAPMKPTKKDSLLANKNFTRLQVRMTRPGQPSRVACKTPRSFSRKDAKLSTSATLSILAWPSGCLHGRTRAVRFSSVMLS